MNGGRNGDSGFSKVPSPIEIKNFFNIFTLKMQIFVLKSPGIEIIPYFKGFGLNTAFLLDMQLLYSYIQPNQKRVFILITTRHGFCREVILARFVVL